MQLGYSSSCPSLLSAVIFSPYTSSPFSLAYSSFVQREETRCSGRYVAGRAPDGLLRDVAPSEGGRIAQRLRAGSGHLLFGWETTRRRDAPSASRYFRLLSL